MTGAKHAPRTAGLRRFTPYPAYKDSGVEWLGKIPAAWTVERLRFVSESNPVPSEVRDLPGDTEVSFVPMEAVGEYGDLSLEVTKQLTDVKSGYTYFRDGDIVIAKITPCFENGKGALADGLTNGIAFGTTELHVLRTTHRADRRYMFYVTLSDAFRRLGEAEMYGAGGQKRVPESFIRSFSHPLPSVSEQRAIAAFLDRETARIDALVAKKERLIELLQEQRTALITRAVTKGLDPSVPKKDSGVEWLGEIPAHWRVVRVKNTLSDRISGPFGSSLTKDSYGGTTYRVYGQEQVIPGDFNVGDYYIPESKYQVMKRYAVQEGDVLLSCVGTFGRAAVVPKNIQPGIINPRLILLRPDQSIIAPAYLECFLRSELSFAQMDEISRGGTMDIINLSMISALVMPLPPESEQHGILEWVQLEASRIDRLLASVLNAVERLKELRTALISAAVTGKVDVREEIV